MLTYHKNFPCVIEKKLSSLTLPFCVQMIFATKYLSFYLISFTSVCLLFSLFFFQCFIVSFIPILNKLTRILSC